MRSNYLEMSGPQHATVTAAFSSAMSQEILDLLIGTTVMMVIIAAVALHQCRIALRPVAEAMQRCKRSPILRARALEIGNDEMLRAARDMMVAFERRSPSTLRRSRASRRPSLPTLVEDGSGDQEALHARCRRNPSGSVATSGPTGLYALRSSLGPRGQEDDCDADQAGIADAVARLAPEPTNLEELYSAYEWFKELLLPTLRARPACSPTRRSDGRPSPAAPLPVQPPPPQQQLQQQQQQQQHQHQAPLSPLSPLSPQCCNVRSPKFPRRGAPAARRPTCTSSGSTKDSDANASTMAVMLDEHVFVSLVLVEQELEDTPTGGGHY